MSALDRLADEIKASTKYRHVARDLICDVGAIEIAKRDNYKEAVKATRNKLHQVCGAYIDLAPHYHEWLADMKQVRESDSIKALQPICRRLMSGHASTRERIPILEDMYATVLLQLPPIHSVLDIACGFNPLAIPWMPLQPGTSYTVIDVFEDLMSFLGEFITLCGHIPNTYAHSVTNVDLPSIRVDLALVLKTIPCLEQIDRRAGLSLLEHINADNILVSFPVQSLGGRSKGMAENYDAHFRSLIMNKPWSCRRIDFAGELVFLVTKSV